MKTAHRIRILAGVAVGAFCTGFAGASFAQVSNSAAYNNPYGMSQAGTNQTVDPSLRDANGNLALVNGQFLSSTMSQQSGVQNMGVMGSGQTETQMGSGVGFGGQAAATGTTTAIGNSLNVVTYGSNDTVVVNAHQINNGSQTAVTNGN